MKYEDEEIFNEEDCPQKLSKKYLLSRMNFLSDIGYSHTRKIIAQNFFIHLVCISSLNGVKLNYPLLYDEAENFNNNNIFNLKELNNDYGRYFLIKGNFGYTHILGSKTTKRFGLFKAKKNIDTIIGGNFSIGFRNNCRAIIYNTNEFNLDTYLKSNRDIISSQKCITAGIIYAGQLDPWDKI